MGFKVLKFKKSSDRYILYKNWLKSKHTFSFSEYQDKEWDNFGSIRVINEDIISANAGFDIHSHSNMEIITLVLGGCITHKDSLNNSERIFSNEIQVMTAGSGISHSEMNENIEKCKFLQIWIYPKEMNLKPSYKKTFYKNQFGQISILDPSNKNQFLSINQNLYLWRFIYKSPKKILVPKKIKTFNWIQVITGQLTINDKKNKKLIHLYKGDGLGFKISNIKDINFKSKLNSDFLLFSMEDL